MNQKGEATVLSTLLIVALSGIVLLCALELRKSFLLLEKRTHLFLCLKETKGELNEFLQFMGRSNWAIKNITKASLIMVFIPGLQGVAANAQKAKKIIQNAQDVRLISYLKVLAQLNQRQCPVDPRMLLTPFKIGPGLLKRDSDGAAELREKKWIYSYLSRPYFLQLEIDASGLEHLKPKITYKSKEKAVKLSSLLSSQ
jgi:hypothetical protein